MLAAINTKILLAILAALTVIGGAALYQRDQAAKTAAAAAKQPQSFKCSGMTTST
jgi:F0F1-type ATP synthase membrane subunit c/vacuolar-type H+-ATPase subunit K